MNETDQLTASAISKVEPLALGASAISEVEQLAIKSTDIKVVNLTDKRAVYFNPATNTAAEFEVPPPRRRHVVDSLDSFIQAVTEFKDNCRVFISADQFTLVIDDAGRRDFCTLVPKFSPQFSAVRSLTGPVSQEQAIRLFFHCLRGACSETLHNTFRRVEFQTNESGKKTRLRDEESMGAEVISRLTASEDIPELINVSPSVFVNNGMIEPETITMTVEVLHSTRQFLIEAEPGSLDIAVDSALIRVADKIRSKTKVEPLLGVFSN